MIAKAVCLLFLLNVVFSNGHFLITKPTTRGFDDDTEPNPPCGGYDTPLTTRAPINLGGSFQLVFTIEDEHGTVLVNFAPGDNPTSDSYSGTDNEYAVFSENGGQYTEKVDVSGLNVVSGTVGTFQVVYESILPNDTAGTTFYQCIDVVFQPAPNNAMKTSLSLALLVFASALSLLL